jgi:hypothetical protein
MASGRSRRGSASLMVVSTDPAHFALTMLFADQSFAKATMKLEYLSTAGI